jgi:hypothetical protein
MKMHDLFAIAIAVCLVSVTAGRVLGQAPTSQEPAKSDGDEEKEREQRMRLMRAMMDGVTLYRLTNAREVEVKLVTEPLTHFSDAARRYQDGTLWAFGRQGRPAALVTCFTNDASTAVWWHAITSLSTDRLRAERQGQVVWTPEEPGVQFRSLPDAPEPAASERGRLLQMRNLARRFTAHQFWDPNNQRSELRLLVRPVHQYRDPESRLLDGAIFIFTHGINPEMLLVLEAVKSDSSAKWQYALVKIGSAEFHAALDGEEVWEEPRAPGVIGRPTDPYCMFRSRPPDLDEPKEKP